MAAWLEHVPVNIYSAHGFYFHDDQRRLSREAIMWLEAMLARITTFTLSQSEEDLRLMTARRYIAPERIAYIGNGIDTDEFAPGCNRELLEHELGLKVGGFRIATVGRLVKGKGFLDLVRAFARLRQEVSNVELLMIGGNIAQDISPFQADLTAECAKLQLDGSVVITGMTDRVADFLAISDSFVLPSYREGMPRALLEAMSSGLPVIATQIRGCREIIENGSNGLLYNPHDVEQLSQLMRRLYLSPELRLRLGRSARETAIQRFSEKGYVARQLEYITAQLAEPVFRSAVAG
jgi:glycosyltransferase involved in cell wall biosynthesis